MKKPNVIKLDKQGFCYGVKRSLKIVQNAVYDPSIPKPIYLLGNVVHNQHIHNYLTNLGVIVIDGENRLEMLDQIPNNSTVLFSAHGVSDKVREKAAKKNLNTIDATCPYVDATFRLVEKASLENDILFIGKSNHPETEAILELSDHAYLVDPKNIYIKGLNEDHVLVAHQTTMSCYDIDNLFEQIKTVYPKAKKLDMICRVTENRQTELKYIDSLEFSTPALIIVVGDKKSNNSTKLYELAKRSTKCDAIFIESVSELNLKSIKKYETIIIASGTSTPLAIINEIENTINSLDKITDEYIESKISLDELV